MSVAERAAALLQSAGVSPVDAPAGAEPATDAASASPPTVSGVGSAPAEAVSPDPPAAVLANGSEEPAPTTAGATNDAHALLAEKLAKVRADNRAKKELARARSEREAAERTRQQVEADRQAAAAERERWAGLGKNGTILETLKAAGRDPREVFEQMKNEAIAAGTPEAQIAAVEAKWRAELASTVEPLKQTIAQLEAERAQLAEASREQRFASDFQRVATDDAYGPLRDEYGDDRLLALTRAMRDDTAGAKQLADKFGVRLTAPERGLTMREILNVLKAAQDEHESQRSTRRSERTASPKTQPAAVPIAGTAKPQVNGTSEKRNAGSTIGNDLATSTATGGPPAARGNSAHARLRDRARRLIG